MPLEFLSTERFAGLDILSLAGPPSCTRLEPQASTGDPRPGIEARVHDPLWLLARQWQLGEFEGEDAGSPLTVRVVTSTRAIDRWAPSGEVQGLALGQAPQDLLEPLVEREPAGAASPGLRARAEAGATLLAALDEAKLGEHGASISANCPLDLDPLKYPGGAQADLDPQWLRLARMLDGKILADAESAASAFEGAGAALPPWLAPGDDVAHVALRAVIDPWLVWYRADVSPLPEAQEGDCWIGERLEYRFKVGAGATVLSAPEHGGGDLDWYSFDPAPDAQLDAPADAEPAQKTRTVHALLASPLRYAGMPADRLWEMEDAQINVGAIETEPWDLARLLVAEFALTYGNDWLVVPVDVPFGSLTTIESVLYTTTFGERFEVKPTAQASPDGHWRMFAIAGRDGAAADGLLIPPGAVAVQDGAPIEEVLFLRDEMANMVWAVERAVQGPSGAARERARERDQLAPLGKGPVQTAQLDYQLMSRVPERWIPYLPRAAGYRAIDLVQARMPRSDASLVAPLGHILNRADLARLKDAEIPREGVLVRRQPSVTRRADGSYLCWTTRRVGVGRGEGASQLAFDGALSRKPLLNQ